MNRHPVTSELRSGAPKLSVGILAGDVMHFGESVRLLEQFGVLIHLDVMDGRIWPKITAGAPILAGLKTKLIKDVHLLIEEPEKHIEDFAKAGADIISISVEHCHDVRQTLARIGGLENANQPGRSILRGASLDPGTSVDVLKDVADLLDVVVLLAVGPDTGKRDFLDQLPEKIAAVRTLREDIVIFLDGAVTKDNIRRLAEMGSDVIVTGSAAFAGDPAVNIRLMLEQIGG